MKIKTLLLTTALCVSTASFAATPAPSKKSGNMFKNFYAKIEAGLSMPSSIKLKDDDKTTLKFTKGFVGGIGGGYKWNEFFRTDLMLQYRQPTTKKNNDSQTKFRNFAVMLNGYLDAHNDTIFTPYAMAGLGVGFTKATTTEGKEKTEFNNKTSLMWNVGLGCQANIYENINLDLGYRYVNMGKYNSKTKTSEFKLKKNITSHEVLLGLTYDL